MSDRVIKTGLSKKYKDMLDAVIGQMSDGYWENTPMMAGYWKFVTTGTAGDEVTLEVDEMSGGRHGNRYINNRFYGLSDDAVKKFFADKIKFLIKEEGLGKWDRDNESETDFLSYDRPRYRVKDCYYAYEILKGRNARKHPEYGDVAEAKEDSAKREKGGTNEAFDGWDGWEEIEGLEDALDDIENLAYELRSCVRGAKTGCKNWAALSRHVQNLAAKLDDAAGEMAYKRDDENESKRSEGKAYTFTWWDNEPAADRRPTTKADLKKCLHKEIFTAADDAEALKLAVEYLCDYIGDDPEDVADTPEEIWDYFDSDWGDGNPIPMVLKQGRRVVKDSGFDPNDEGSDGGGWYKAVEKELVKKYKFSPGWAELCVDGNWKGLVSKYFNDNKSPEECAKAINDSGANRQRS